MSSAWENCAESCNLIFAPTLAFKVRRELALENVTLREQLAVLCSLV